jgi:hypothetical protein
MTLGDKIASSAPSSSWTCLECLQDVKFKQFCAFQGAVDNFGSAWTWSELTTVRLCVRVCVCVCVCGGGGGCRVSSDMRSGSPQHYGDESSVD